MITEEELNKGKIHPGFKKGEKLLCVWDWTPAKRAFPDLTIPKFGEIYTVRGLIHPEPQNDAPYWSVLLREFENEVLVEGGHETAFNCEGFVKVLSSADAKRFIATAEANQRRQ